ncbi:ZDHC4 palmitoyltransferase, partial [Crotophaga sulcirostris]|nr:ZDHC4 palmitoyltransferase [Crotophaga sulcirostris]
MEFVTLLGIYLCTVLAAVVLLCFCSGRKEGFLARSTSSASQVLSFVIPAQLQRVMQRGLHRFFHTRSCLFVGLNIALQVAVYGEYTWEVFVYCWELQFPLLLLLLPYLLLAGNMGCFILCSRTDPGKLSGKWNLKNVTITITLTVFLVSFTGIITKSNHASLVKVYAYDDVLFRKGIMCPTCNLEKPARSKHCSLCSVCVYRFDHHCVWVNSCIGAFNAKYFLLYLLTLAATATAIAIITAAFLIQVVLLSNLMEGRYLGDEGHEHAVDILFLIQHLFMIFPRIVVMLGFVMLLTLVLGAYCCFTLYLVLTNQTSDEWCRSRRYRSSHHLTPQPPGRQVVYRNIYSKGGWMNLKEIFTPPTVLERKKK